jgi:hypothetical protein
LRLSGYKSRELVLINMQNHTRSNWSRWALRIALAFGLGASANSAFTQDPESAAPWRRSDSTFVQLCFDGLDESAPKRISAATLAGGGLVSSGLDLMGFTLSGRPVYQAALSHPVRFRSLYFLFPSSEIWGRIDAPKDFEKRIDAWRDVDVAGCTADAYAGFKVLNNVPVASAACPEMGLHAVMKVAAGAENSIELIRLRSSGPKVFNGLRGCREFVYGPRSVP